MLCLEELTQEELINWVRENVSDLDEDKLVVDVLIRRRDAISKASEKWFERHNELNLEISQLVQKYADGPIRHGVRLRNWPAEARREYARLDELRKDAWVNYQVCSSEVSKIHYKIIGFAEERIEKNKKTILENWEK